jgi:hypothetical protein
MADVRDADGDLLQQFLVSQRINLVWESLGSSRGHNYVETPEGNYVEKEPALYSVEANGFFVQQLPAYVERLASEGGRRVAIFLCDKTYNQLPSILHLDQTLPGLLLRPQTKESPVFGGYVPAPGWEIVLHDAATTAWRRFIKDGDTIVLSRQFPLTDGAIVVVVVPGDVSEGSDGVPRCQQATAAAAAAAASAESKTPCHWVSNFFSECGPDLMRTGYSGMCRHAVQICEDPNVAYLQLQPGSAGDDVMLIANADQLEASISIKELEVRSMILKNQKSWTKNERTLLSFVEKRKNQSVTHTYEMADHTTIDQEEMDCVEEGTTEGESKGE